MTESSTPTAGSGTQITVTDFLRQQHETVKATFAKLSAATGDERRDLFDELRRMLAVHETAEEICIHPEAREISPEAERVVEARLAEEKKAKVALKELEDIGPDGGGFNTKLAAFRSDAEAHAAAEERELFPLIEANVSRPRLVELAETLQETEELAPTHAHPHSPTSGIGNVLLGSFAAMADKVRDWFAGRKNR
jgi:hemerythrin superfamily protein